VDKFVRTTLATVEDPVWIYDPPNHPQAIAAMILWTW